MNPHLSLNEHDDAPILGEKMTKEDVLALKILKTAKKIEDMSPKKTTFLASPGVSVTITDDSYYVPSAGPTYGLVFTGSLSGANGISTLDIAKPQSTCALRTYSSFFDTLDEVGAVMDEAFGKNEWMIAGGCVRDTLLGRPVKDIDVFVRGKAKEETVEKVMKMVGGKGFKCQEGYYGNAFHVADIDSSIWGYPIQIISIGKQSLQSHLMTFGASISKVSYTTDGLFVSREFQDDANNSTITVTGSKGEARLDAYIERISRKYPGFTIQYAEEMKGDDLLDRVLARSAAETAARVLARSAAEMAASTCNVSSGLKIDSTCNVSSGLKIEYYYPEHVKSAALEYLRDEHMKTESLLEKLRNRPATN